VSDWRQYCRDADGISLDGDNIDVMLTKGRHHSIRIRETSETYELSGVVARPEDLDVISDVPLRAWRHNRAMLLVGFRMDQKARLVGEAWVPKAGLDENEFLLYVRRLAEECDLFEFHLTGKDRE
jgi:hypothetical protein